MTTITDEALEQVRQVMAQNERLRKALEGLISKLDEIHGNSAYKGVWEISQIHCGPYRGPTYTEELQRARAALKEHQE